MDKCQFSNCTAPAKGMYCPIHAGWLLRNGLCYQCHQKKEYDIYSLCLNCHHLTIQAKRQQAIREGRCIKCSQPSTGHPYCHACYVAYRRNLGEILPSPEITPVSMPPPTPHVQPHAAPAVTFQNFPSLIQSKVTKVQKTQTPVTAVTPITPVAKAPVAPEAPKMMTSPSIRALKIPTPKTPKASKILDAPTTHVNPEPIMVRVYANQEAWDLCDDDDLDYSRPLVFTT
jgi:hypothetical protein